MECEYRVSEEVEENLDRSESYDPIMATHVYDRLIVKGSSSVYGSTLVTLPYLFLYLFFVCCIIVIELSSV